MAGRAPTPEDLLKKAMTAKSPTARARFAKQGLATRAALDRTVQAMLLRQLYLAHFETKRFTAALEVAESALELDVLPDVLHQDAARAALAQGELDGAVAHLRAAARRGPASPAPVSPVDPRQRALPRASLPRGQRGALERAVRWGTRDKPLYRAHLALARIAGGERLVGSSLQRTIDELAAAPCGQGYGRFVLGHLAYAAGEFTAARRYLDAFVKRTEAARTAMGIALAGEVKMAKATLAKMAPELNARNGAAESISIQTIQCPQGSALRTLLICPGNDDGAALA